jgi:hypothetical protein
MKRGDLELLPAGLADQLVVEPEEVIAELGELRAVALVGAGRQAILLGTTNPAHAVLIRAPAARAGVAGRSRLGLVGEEGALVESHTQIVLQGPRERLKAPRAESRN